MFKNLWGFSGASIEPLGITIVIEPLNKKESNIITSVPETVALVEKVNRPSIQVLADLYHMMEENESLENIKTARSYLQYVHVADSGRMVPETGTYPNVL
ncbi:TIM barrel protein [Gracilibacillus saliphilus]|uniref:TIM barrel protein n=1 Tax=Gracilibacillus saliphilus TaxID=543890 RepID=UPI0013D3BE34|nr:TIM barrel protein [Gracilibacillus saliphilus]